MDNSFNIYNLKEPLREHIMALVERSMETFEDVGLVIENDGDVRFDKGSFSIKPKSIFRAQRVDLITVHDNEELQTIGVEIQVVKGGRGEAGKTAWFFKLPVTLKAFQYRYPGYDSDKLLGGLKVEHDADGDVSVKIEGVYRKDDHLENYLNKIFGSMIRHTRKMNKDKNINLMITDNGDLIARYL